MDKVPKSTKIYLLLLCITVTDKTACMSYTYQMTKIPNRIFIRFVGAVILSIGFGASAYFYVRANMLPAWNTYANSRLGFSFQYPPNLKLEEDKCAEDVGSCFTAQQHILDLADRGHEWLDLFYSPDIDSALSYYDVGDEMPEDHTQYQNLDGYFLTLLHSTTTVSASIPAYLLIDARDPESHSVWFEQSGIYTIVITDPNIFPDGGSVQLPAWEKAILSSFRFR